MKIRYLLILFLFFVVACSQEDEPVVDQQSLTFEDFQKHLTPEMDFHSIKAIFGDPSDDIGSGIHIYVYKLADANEIWIGYADQILYARHMDSDQQVIQDLIN